MSLAAKIIGLFVAMEPHHLTMLAPNTRRRFAQLCRHWADIADPPLARTLPTVTTAKAEPRSGVLYEIKNGAPRHE